MCRDLPFLKSTGARITHLVMYIASKPTCDTSGAKDALAHKPVKAIQNKPASTLAGLKEWKAILKAGGFAPSFHVWLLQHHICDDVPLDLPSVDQLVPIFENFKKYTDDFHNR